MAPPAHAAMTALLERLRRGRSVPTLLGPSAADVLVREADEALAEVVPRTIRHAAEAFVAAQRRLAEAGAEWLVAPTARTSARALNETGFAYRAAALTGAAIDLTRDAALASGARAAIVGEVVAHRDGRDAAEMRLHLERLALANVDAVLVLGDDLERAAEIAALVAAHGIATIAEIPPAAASDAAARLAGVVVRAGDPEAIASAIERMREAAPDTRYGARLPTGGDATATQLAAQAAWGALARRHLDFLGATGATALSGLRALRELSRDGA